MKLATRGSTTTAATEAISLDADESYYGAWLKLQALKTRLLEIERQRSGILTGLNRDIGRDEELTARAAALLQDGTNAVVPLPTDARLARLRADLQTLNDERRVVERAIELQKEVLERERQRVSREICARLEPHYRELVRALGEALVTAGRANQELEDLHREIAAQGLTQLLRPMQFRHLGRLDDQTSRINAWLADAREHGLIS